MKSINSTKKHKGKNKRSTERDAFADGLTEWVGLQETPFTFAEAAEHLGIQEESLTREVVTRIGITLRNLGCKKVMYRRPYTHHAIKAWVKPSSLSFESSIVPIRPPQSLFQESQLCNWPGETSPIPAPSHQPDDQETSGDRTQADAPVPPKESQLRPGLQVQFSLEQNQDQPSFPLSIKVNVIVNDGTRRG